MNGLAGERLKGIPQYTDNALGQFDIANYLLHFDYVNPFNLLLVCSQFYEGEKDSGDATSGFVCLNEATNMLQVKPKSAVLLILSAAFFAAAMILLVGNAIS